ncbi:MAG: hypothetical protein ACI8UD_003887, partial [Planctomycetota bacterium]
SRSRKQLPALPFLDADVWPLLVWDSEFWDSEAWDSEAWDVPSPR